MARGFLVVTPGITIKDRLRVLLPSDPDNYYRTRELVPQDMMNELGNAKVVVTNYHALLATALFSLYDHYKREFEEWERAGIGVPPAFIVVCNNTATSRGRRRRGQRQRNAARGHEYRGAQGTPG